MTGDRYPENMPILYRNALDSMPSDFARAAWLWAVERPGMDRMGYAADWFALEADSIRKSLAPIFDMAAKAHGLPEHSSDLMEFILKRHANFRFGGNVNPDYLGEPT
jgi:hypothetical protein